jgi:hypothetical protein
VYRRPVVAILSTGNELVELTESQSGTGPSGTSNGWTGVVDTNRPSLRATLEGLGYEVVDVGIAKDQCVDWDLRESCRNTNFDTASFPGWRNSVQLLNVLSKLPMWWFPPEARAWARRTS